MLCCLITVTAALVPRFQERAAGALNNDCRRAESFGLWLLVVRLHRYEAVLGLEIRRTACLMGFGGMAQ
jgi:hypothetical protein